MSDRLAAAIASIPLELERVRTELAAGMAQWADARRLQGARPLPVGPGGRVLAWAGPGRLVGWSIATTGTTADVTLRDGRDESGDVVAVVSLAADASQTVWLGPGGVSLTEGLRVEGAEECLGAVWIGAVD